MTNTERKLSLVTASVHKEITRGARNQHDKAMKDLTNQLNEYFDPFLDGPARHFKSGVEIEQVVMEGLLSSDEIGEKCFKDFVERRIKAKEEEKISIFEPIKRQNIQTGLRKKKKQDKKIDILKEDRQAFGLLVGKVQSPEEALQYPLTSVPLALANINKDLRPRI